jgi:hypothetical protein
MPIRTIKWSSANRIPILERDLSRPVAELEEIAFLPDPRAPGKEFTTRAQFSNTVLIARFMPDLPEWTKRPKPLDPKGRSSLGRGETPNPYADFWVTIPTPGTERSVYAARGEKVARANRARISVRK